MCVKTAFFVEPTQLLFCTAKVKHTSDKKHHTFLREGRRGKRRSASATTRENEASLNETARQLNSDLPVGGSVSN